MEVSLDGRRRVTLRQIATSCSACHRVLSDAETLFTEAGDPICEQCSQKRQASASHERSGDSTRALAFGNPLLGIASFFFNPFFLLSAGAIGNGLYALKKGRSDAARGEGSSKTRGPNIAAVIGMSLGAASVALRLLG
jgi:hypothetical protein